METSQRIVQSFCQGSYHLAISGLKKVQGKFLTLMTDLWKAAHDPSLKEAITVRNLIEVVANVFFFKMHSDLYVGGFITGFFIQKLFPDSTAKLQEAVSDAYAYTVGNKNIIVRIAYVVFFLLIAPLGRPYTFMGLTFVFSVQMGSSFLKNSFNYANKIVAEVI